MHSFRVAACVLLGCSTILGCERRQAPAGEPANTPVATGETRPAAASPETNQSQAATSAVNAPEVERTPEAVQAVFASYKTAILNSRGEEAVECVDAQTVDWYAQVRGWGLSAPREELEGLSLMNRIQAILVRHRVPREELEMMDGRGLFIYAVNNGWVGKSSVSDVSVGGVTISDDFAAAAIVKGEQETPVKFQFVVEGGQWRLKLLPIMKMAEPALQAQAKRAGQSENEFIVGIAEAVSGRKVPDEIWDAGK